MLREFIIGILKQIHFNKCVGSANKTVREELTEEEIEKIEATPFGKPKFKITKTLTLEEYYIGSAYFK